MNEHEHEIVLDDLAEHKKQRGELRERGSPRG
jgi:hypothetical protein